MISNDNIACFCNSNVFKNKEKEKPTKKIILFAKIMTEFSTITHSFQDYKIDRMNKTFFLFF